MSEHENAPAAPPEGAITRWGYDYVNQGDQLVERDDGGYVLYADHAAALASATARAERAEAVAHVLSLGMGRAALALGLPNDPNVSPDHLVDAAVALRRSADASHRAASDNAQRANEAEAALATAQAEAERLRVDGDRRVEAMREASMKAECRGCAADLAVVDGASIGYPGVPMHDYPSEDGPFRSSCSAWRIRALSATPAPGPSADTPNAQEKETR